jgi:hypothetical protein
MLDARCMMDLRRLHPGPLAVPPLEAVGPDKTPICPRRRSLAELVATDRFAGYVGALPMDNPTPRSKRPTHPAERQCQRLAAHTNVNGACLDEPRFLPIFEVPPIGKPILLHPARKPMFRFPGGEGFHTRSGRSSAGVRNQRNHGPLIFSRA